MGLAQRDVDERWQFYEQMAGVTRVTRTPAPAAGAAAACRPAGEAEPAARIAGGHSMSVDLRTRYLGLELQNPLVVSASPLTGQLDSLNRLEEAGAAAVVLPSLFEEQIEHEEMATHNLMLADAELSREAHAYFPEMENYNTGPDHYLRLIAEAKQARHHPGHRQPERRTRRAAGPATRAASRRPAPTPWSSTSTSWPPTRDDTRAAVEAALPRPGRSR